MTDLRPPGVYFDMNEEDYFPQGLGSTDLVHLFLHKAGFWWRKYNPHHKEPESKFKVRGRALHCALMEGWDAFDYRYAVLPDPADYPNLLVTTDDIKKALREAEAPPPKSQARKSDLIAHCKLYLRDRPVWDAIMEQFALDYPEQTPIDAETYRHIQAVEEAIHSDDELSSLLKPKGPVISELSVIWIRPTGHRMRFRFDALFPQFAFDLKSMEVIGGQPIEETIGRRIEDLHMDVQCALSFEARQALYTAIAEKRVEGGTKEQRAWLRKFPERVPIADAAGKPNWGWLWLFCQWPNDQSGRAPDITPAYVEFGENLHREGARKYLEALDTFDRFSAQFGTTNPWFTTRPVHGFESGAHQIKLPMYRNLAMRHPDEEALLSCQPTP